MLQRPAVRYGLYGLAAVTGGYGSYIFYHIYSTQQAIADRQLLNTNDYRDPTKRFAALKIHGRYVNPFTEYRHQTLFEFFYCRVKELFVSEPRGGIPRDPRELITMLPTGTPSKEILAGKNMWGIPSVAKRLSVTWIGQSCAFVQLPGLVNILTDPMFSMSVVSPNVGPQRLIAPPCTLNDLPKPSVVLVSHDHQDHLDLDAAKQIGDSASWVVPKGVGRHLAGVGVKNVIEMSWWDKIPLPGADPKLGYELACTPSMHWSGRTLIDANQTLWCSFLVLKNGKPLFFHAGDTGFAHALFDGIAKVYGKGCTVAMVPCGAYNPRWHLKSQHMNPEEAVQVAKLLGASNAIGVHWGTFLMSEEPFMEPPRRLIAAAETNAIEAVAPKFGETLVYKIN